MSMNTMTELFYGPVEPTWIVHPQYHPGNKRPIESCYANPYAIYTDEAYTYRRNPYMWQRNPVPYNTVMGPPEGGPYRQIPQGMMYPYQAQCFVQGAGNHQGPNNNVQAHVAPNNQVAQMQSPAKQVQSPARPVLQPRNVDYMQTVHFMVPLCCEKCESRVKEQLLDLDDVQRVTCDQWSQKVTVTSFIAPERLLKRLQKIKKRSAFWPQQQQTKGNQKANQVVTNDENVVVIN